uniref:Notum, palmitoleoyl-protein carboxylesterase n=1 Tax=Astyanax mexicanus TaxID=7994 RepID=A0A8B9JFW6_ASTMX
MRQVQNLAQSLYPCSTRRLDQDMKLRFLENSTVTCNDGSPAGYYIRESKGSRRWLVFLEGGWYCFSKENCASRYETMRRLMSSCRWPNTRSGILSPQPEENPHWWNANMVFIPYCSSDVWSGATPKTDQNDYAFMGSLIIQEVIKELLTKGLDNAKVLLLAGSRSLIIIFHYALLSGPVFVVQWLFDEAQLTVDNVHLMGQPVQEDQWRYIQNLGIDLRNTLKNVPAMFAPACLSHEVITRSYWMDIQVKGTSLPRALQCWDRSLHHSLRNHGNSSSHRSPPRGCPLHLIDSCPWPHCNPTCPAIRDQLTGREMNVIQFLTHMGFDVQRMAQQQGLDPNKLLGMLNSGT